MSGSRISSGSAMFLVTIAAASVCATVTIKSISANVAHSHFAAPWTPSFVRVRRFVCFVCHESPSQPELSETSRLDSGTGSHSINFTEYLHACHCSNVTIPFSGVSM
jgi:hypothetical protein